jgi:hypothetical protein
MSFLLIYNSGDVISRVGNLSKEDLDLISKGDLRVFTVLNGSYVEIKEDDYQPIPVL